MLNDTRPHLCLLCLWLLQVVGLSLLLLSVYHSSLLAMQWIPNPSGTEGRCAAGHIPESRFAADNFFHPDTNRLYTVRYLS
jgi:hypothetical protein